MTPPSAFADMSARPQGDRRQISPVKSADRTVELLELLADSPRPLRLAEVQRLLGLPKSSAHGLVHTLLARGWIESDDSGTSYGIGIRALRVGAAFLDRDRVVTAAAPAMAELRQAVDETVHLARLDGAEILYLASRESRHHLRVTSRIGRRLPAHATALGRALLATRDWAEVDALLPSELVALTAETITDRAVLRAELDETRVRGWAVERGQSTPGLVCYAVAVPTPDGRARDAFSCSLPATRDSAEHGQAIVSGLIDCARIVAGPSARWV